MCVYFMSFFFFNDTATTEIYTLSLHDALPISTRPSCRQPGPVPRGGSPARLVPGGGHGGAVRGRRVRHRPPGDGGGRRVARGPSGEGASGAGRREACDNGERGRGGVPQGRPGARSPPLVGGSGPLPEQGAPPGEIARSLTPCVRPRQLLATRPPPRARAPWRSPSGRHDPASSGSPP